MPKIIEIEIKIPIWKNRSVGINLADANPSDTIQVTIAYTRKQDGKKPYPFIYILTAQEVHNYGIKYIKNGIPLYEVPITAFRIANNNQPKQSNNNQNPKTMMFDSKEIEKIRKENQENKGGGDSRPIITPGEHLLQIDEIKLEFSKKDKAPMIVITMAKSDQYRPLSEYFKLSGAGSEFGRSRLIDLLERAFAYVMQACNDENDVLKQCSQFLKRKLKVAVQHELDIYIDPKKNESWVTFKPKGWYYGAEKDATFSMDPSKHIKQLKADVVEKINDQQKLGMKVNWAAGTKEGIGTIPVMSAPVKSETTTAPTMAENLSVDEPRENTPAEDNLPF